MLIIFYLLCALSVEFWFFEVWMRKILLFWVLLGSNFVTHVLLQRVFDRKAVWFYVCNRYQMRILIIQWTLYGKIGTADLIKWHWFADFYPCRRVNNVKITFQDRYQDKNRSGKPVVRCVWRKFQPRLTLLMQFPARMTINLNIDHCLRTKFFGFCTIMLRKKLIDAGYVDWCSKDRNQIRRDWVKR